MIATKDHSVSIWQNIDSPLFETLEANAQADVCIVGAGIAGLTIGYELSKRGASVIIIDDGEIGGRQTLKTTAHVSNAFDDRYFKIEEMYGRKISEAIASSHTTAIEYTKYTVQSEAIFCDLRVVDGYLFLDPKHSESFLHKELRAANAAGIPSVEYVQSIQEFPSLGPALRFRQQVQFHPGKYVLGLANCILKNHGKIYRNTRAVEINNDPYPHVVIRNGHQITAHSIVIATNVPMNSMLRYHTKQAAYRSYVNAYNIKKGIFPSLLLWDTADPYHYVRQQLSPNPEYDYLLVGGEDHRTGEHLHHDPYERLDHWAQAKFPYLGPIAAQWSGQIIEPVDGIAYIGRFAPDRKPLYVVTGDSGNGTTHAPIAALIISDLIYGRENRWSQAYAPNRHLSLKSAPTFLKENAVTTAKYFRWIRGSEVSSAADVPHGKGAVLSDGLRKKAVYRDEKGRVHECSAVCPHLGGIVRWNDREKSWDCPCHGSRFNAYGELINGPARHDLEQHYVDNNVVHIPKDKELAGDKFIREAMAPL